MPNLNTEYFIERIEHGIKENDVLNGKTNVLGEMTSWQFFNRDLQFLSCVHKLMDYVENNVSVCKYSLRDSWGIKESFGHYTKEHNHRGFVWSGVIYLSNVNQPLLFTDINEKVEAKTGNFAIFSSFLNHKTENRAIYGDTKYGIAFNFGEANDF